MCNCTLAFACFHRDPNSIKICFFELPVRLPVKLKSHSQQLVDLVTVSEVNSLWRWGVKEVAFHQHTLSDWWAQIGYTTGYAIMLFSQFVTRWSFADLSSPVRLLIHDWQKRPSEPVLSMITSEMKMHFILTLSLSLVNSSSLNFHNSLCLCFCFRIKRNTWTPSTTTWRSTAPCTVPARCTFRAMWRTTAF